MMCSVVVATARAAEPKPPWQRLLTGDDAKKAAGLQQRIGELEAADRYAEVINLSEELLALRTNVQGAEHWQTVSQKWALTALKKVASLPAEQRTGWRQAARDIAEARRLMQQAQYGKALPLWQERLKWCRQVLGEEHPHTALSYNNLAANLWSQGKYTEAGPLYQKALDINRKALGEEHPETATSYDNLASNLDDQGKHAEAGLLLQKALDIRRKTLGEEHPHTASSYNNVAYNLESQGKYAEAGPLYQRALDIQRKVLGENHPDTARGYNNLASNLNAQGKYAEAGPLLQKALDIWRKSRGEQHPDTAVSYNNLAVNLQSQGKYAAAGPLFRKALDIWRKALGEEHPHTAQSYNSVASNLHSQGKYAEAGPLHQKALDIQRKVLGEEHPHTAASYNNLAANLDDQRRHAEAEPLFRKALNLRRKALGEYHPSTAESYNNLAGNLLSQGKYAQAGPLFQKALDINRKVLGEEHPNTANSYNSLAFNLASQGMHAEAGPMDQKALEVFRKALGENHPDTAASNYNVAVNLHAQGKYAAALASVEASAHSYEAARLGVAAAGLQRAAFGAERSPYPLLVAARNHAGRADDAWSALEADLARGLLDEMVLRRGAGLTPGEGRQNDELRNRLAPLEARVLALVRRPQRTAAEDAELERLLERRQKLDDSLADLAVVVSNREVTTLEQLQAALPADAAFLAWADAANKSGALQEHWGCVVRRKGQPHWERLPGSTADGKWTAEDTQLPTQFREALAKSASVAEIDALAKKLHAQRLAPLAKHLDGVKRLVVAPVNRMAGIPVEALTEQYTVSYTPSGTYLARLQERKPLYGTRLLAVGDPLFLPTQGATPPTALPPGGLLLVQVVPGGNAAKARLQAGDVLVSYAGQELTSGELLRKLLAAKAGEKSVVVQVWREGQAKLAERELASGLLGVVLAKESAREAITARRQTDQMLAQLTRGDNFAELPGTQVEIARLTGLFDAQSVTTLTRADASEQRLDQLRKAGELKQFRYLHLATHGQANNVRAFDSALILTRPDKLPEPRAGEPYLDGRLTAAEVLEYWKLDADLVTLSACESGLGRQGGGDGLLGFAQAFLSAGSRSVCLSLWQVDDTPTALLMDRFYRNLLGKREGGAKPMGKAAALREAK
jgi:CHAT domain-containing protein/tetratricopeptide (TPR) repeat protein